MINARKGDCLVFVLVLFLLSFCYVASPATADDPSALQPSPTSNTKNVSNPSTWKIIGIGLITGLILIAVERFLQPLQRLATYFKRRIQYRYGNAYAALDGGVQLLNRKLLLRSVESKQVQLYYEGIVRLSWGIIAACADIERDKQEDLVKLLRSKHQTGKLSIVCVTGEPGAGKSTLAWRTAAKLCEEDRSLVLWMKKRNDAEMWLRLEETVSLAQRKCYVLVDDLFHDDEVLQAVSQIDPFLPLTILASSGQHEFRHCGLTCELLEFPLGLPTEHEKRGMLEKLGKRMEDLTPDQRKRLDNATQFRVLMAELTTGKGHIEAIQETVRELCNQDPTAYDAYKYICFATQYDISIPETTLEQIRPGEFYKVIERSSVKGFIYRDVVNSTRLNAGHPTRAAAAFAAYHRSAQQVLLKIVDSVDQTCRDSRYFVVFLVLKALAADRSDLDPALPELAQLLLGISNNVELISEGLLWCKCFQNLGMSEAVEGIERRLPSMSPVSNNECRKLLRVCRKRGREEDALPAVAEFVYQNPNASRGTWAMSLHLTGRYGTPDQIQEALKRAWKQLEFHPSDDKLLGAYLNLLRDRTNSKQITVGLKKIVKWLLAHPTTGKRPTLFLSTLRQAEPDQIRGILHRCATWFDENSGPGTITLLLTLTAKYGGPTEIKEAFDGGRKWVEKHPRANSVIHEYFKFIEQKGTSAQIKNVTEEILEDFRRSKEGGRIRSAVLQIATEKGPLAMALESTFRNVVDTCGVEAVASGLDYQTKLQFVRWLSARGYEEQTEKIYKEIVTASHDSSKRGLELKVLYSYGTFMQARHRFEEAAELFRKLLSIRKGHLAARVQLGKTLHMLGKAARDEGRFGDANKCFRDAENEMLCALDKTETPYSIHAHLGWLYLSMERHDDALYAFDESERTQKGEYFANHWGRGKALMRLGRIGEAEVSFTKAMELAPEDLRQPASDEIPRLLKECRDQVA